MSTISYDGQSFIVDGRRVWLVSGSIHYPRTPHKLWHQRIRAAKQAGLNCIATDVFWNAHEPQPGRFVFDGDLDLRRFVQLIGEEGMYCILRPGPYVNSQWDFGGLPPWLNRAEQIKLRQAQPAFLEACSRYLGAVMEQVSDLQITAPIAGLAEHPYQGNRLGAAAGGFVGGGGGPILLIQAENEWFCHNPQEAEAYLREIVRYLRENGCTVPISNCNHLWQRIEGTIDTWNGNRHLATDLRQLAVVQPNAPRIASEYRTGWFDHWGSQVGQRQGSADLTLHQMVQILASGAQYNLSMFHGGTNFAFWGGRSAADLAGFITTSYDCDAPLLEAGGRGPKYLAIKRLSTFASQFHHVLAHLDPGPPHAAANPTDDDHPLSIIHLRGSQGQVIFLLRGSKDKTASADVMLPNGLTLPVPMGRDRVAWLLLAANLGGAAELNYTNLRPWAFVNRRMLVLFGPAGSDGLVCIDDVQHQISVPTGREPTVLRHEAVLIVVLNGEQLDAAYLTEAGVAVGSSGLDDSGQPLPLRGWPTLFVVGLDGKITRRNSNLARRPATVKLGGWARAPLDHLVTGAANEFESIEGPASLEQLGTNYGYGWYKISIGTGRAGKMIAPRSGDRLHLYGQGNLQAILGVGPGAEHGPVQCSLRGDLIVLADNLGRYCDGQDLGESKGLFGHLYTVRSVKLGKPKIVSRRAPDPFQLSGLVLHRRKGERPPAEALLWTIKPAGRRPLILDIQGLPLPALLLINGQPLALYGAELSGRAGRYLLTPGAGALTRGRNELMVALYGSLDPKVDPLKHIRLYEATATVTARRKWAYCPWAIPADEAFTEPMPDRPPDPPQPAWYRGRFQVRNTTVPLWLELRGMSKGQIFVNGHNAGRYFVATRDAQTVPPQKLYYLPEPWLRSNEPNELLLFEEHGKSPSRCRLVYHEMGPYQS